MTKHRTKEKNYSHTKRHWIPIQTHYSPLLPRAVTGEPAAGGEAAHVTSSKQAAEKDNSDSGTSGRAAHQGGVAFEGSQSKSFWKALPFERKKK